MTRLLSLIVAAAFAVASASAIAQEKKADPAKAQSKAQTKKEPTAAQKKQQERMKQCNMQADERKMKGDERKKFMSGCLKPPAKKSGEVAKKTEKKS